LSRARVFPFARPRAARLRREKLIVTSPSRTNRRHSAAREFATARERRDVGKERAPAPFGIGLGIGIVRARVSKGSRRAHRRRRGQK